MALKRMDNVGIVVDDLEVTIAFFRELGLDLEGRATIEGEWAGRVTGLGDQRVEIAMMRTPDVSGNSATSFPLSYEPGQCGSRFVTGAGDAEGSTAATTRCSGLAGPGCAAG